MCIIKVCTVAMTAPNMIGNVKIGVCPLNYEFPLTDRSVYVGHGITLSIFQIDYPAKISAMIEEHYTNRDHGSGKMSFYRILRSLTCWSDMQVALIASSTRLALNDESLPSP